MKKICCLTSIILSLLWANAFAQVRVDTGAYGVKVDQSGGVLVNTTPGKPATIGADVQMDGITIINGNLFIDGEKVPKGQRAYTSKKTKKSYKIEWGNDGNISVAEK